MTTVAPGTMAFCGSVTVPVMVEERICADAIDAAKTMERVIRTSEQSRCFNTTDLLHVL
jgi:hypothetical protein